MCDIGGGGGRLFEAGRLFTSSAFRMGAYSNKCGTPPDFAAFKIVLHSFLIVFLFILEIGPILITSVGLHNPFFEIVFSN